MNGQKDSISIDPTSWMDHALQLALRGTGMVSPNPRVGCVIVDNDVLLAEGWHAEYGGPHAEAVALQALSAPVTDNTVMYVTLEPCNHHGKTPPCSEAIVRSGIRRVVVAVEDPHPKVAGTGIAYLRSHGIDVQVGVRRGEASWLNRSFFHHATTGMPYVAVKTAASRDGFMAPEPKERQQLTGAASQRVVHELRAEFDAVLTTAATVQIDDPRLDVRFTTGRNPIRIVLDVGCSTPQNAQVVCTARKQRTMLVVPDATTPSMLQPYLDNGCELLFCRVQHRGGFDLRGFDLHDVFTSLGAMGITSILTEAGPELSSVLLTMPETMEWYKFTTPTNLHRGYGLVPQRPDIDSHRWLLHHQISVEPDNCRVYLSTHHPLIQS